VGAQLIEAAVQVGPGLDEAAVDLRPGLDEPAVEVLAGDGLLVLAYREVGEHGGGRLLSEQGYPRLVDDVAVLLLQRHGGLLDGRGRTIRGSGPSVPPPTDGEQG